MTIAGAAVGFYLIMNKLTKGGGLFGGIGRKFQQEQHENDLTDTNNFFDDVVDQFWIGMFALSWCVKLISKIRSNNKL